MTPRAIARLCFKVLAVYTLVGALGNASQFVWILQAAWGGGPMGAGSLLGQIFALLVASTPLLQIVLAVWLWLKAGVVAAWAVGYDLQDSTDEPDGAAARTDVSAPADEIQAMVFCCLGVWVLVAAIPETFATIASALYATQGSGYPDFGDQISRQATIQFVALFIRLAIGFWLLFGAAGLVRLVNRVRGIGLGETRTEEGSGKTGPGPDAGEPG